MLGFASGQLLLPCIQKYSFYLKDSARPLLQDHSDYIEGYIQIPSPTQR